LNIKVFDLKDECLFVFELNMSLIIIILFYKKRDNVIITKPFCEKRFHYRIECISFENSL